MDEGRQHCADADVERSILPYQSVEGGVVGAARVSRGESVPEVLQLRLRHVENVLRRRNNRVSLSFFCTMIFAILSAV